MPDPAITIDVSATSTACLARITTDPARGECATSVACPHRCESLGVNRRWVTALRAATSTTDQQGGHEPANGELPVDRCALLVWLVRRGGSGIAWSMRTAAMAAAVGKGRC